jgi:hypothetical protein
MTHEGPSFFSRTSDIYNMIEIAVFAVVTFLAFAVVVAVGARAAHAAYADHVRGRENRRQTKVRISHLSSALQAEILELDRRKANVADLLRHANGVKTAIDGLQSGLGAANADIRAVRTDLGVARSDIGAAKSDIGAAKSDIRATQAQTDTIKRDLAALKAALNDRLAVADHAKYVKSVDSRIEKLAASVGWRTDPWLKSQLLALDEKFGKQGTEITARFVALKAAADAAVATAGNYRLADTELGTKLRGEGTDIANKLRAEGAQLANKLRGEGAELEKRLQALNVLLAAKAESATVATAKATFVAALDKHKTLLDGLDAKYKELMKAVTALETKIGTVGSGSASTGSVSSNADLIAVNAKLGVLESGLDSLRTQMSGKLDASIFTTFQTTNNVALGKKADATALAAKLDASYKTSNDAALGSKADKTDLTALTAKVVGISSTEAALTIGGAATANNVVVEAGKTSDGNNAGFSAINFNGRYANGEKATNAAKSRWRLGVDQRGSTDRLFIDQYKPGGSWFSALSAENGTVTMDAALVAKKLQTSSSIERTDTGAGGPGPLIQTTYGNDVNHRYGVGQWPNGATRMYAATHFGNSSVNLSFSKADGSFNDVLTAKNNPGNAGGTVSVNGNMTVDGQMDAAGIHMTRNWTGAPDAGANVSEISNDTTVYKQLMIVGNKAAGGVRKVGVWDRLDVNGTLAVNGGSTVSGSSTVSGNSAVSGSSTVGGSSTVSGNSAVKGDVTVGGQLCVGTECMNQVNLRRMLRYVRRPEVGLSENNPAVNAAQILEINGPSEDGVYWIKSGTSGAKKTYCLMDYTKWSGGGWMLIMKMGKGDTFSYAKSHWTSSTTLNTTSTNMTVADAKFDVFNSVGIRDVMALFPKSEVTIAGGCIADQTDYWVWMVNDWWYNSGSRTTALAGFNSPRDARPASPVEFCGFKAGVFSQQAVARRHIFGGHTHLGAGTVANWGSVRWGLVWNENGKDDHNSNDVWTGIGTGGQGAGNYSAGDYWGCCGQAGSLANKGFPAFLFGR